jgi:hypothetical protein
MSIAPFETPAEKAARRAQQRAPIANMTALRVSLPVEGAPAVSARRSKAPRVVRNYRVNTDITPEAGALLDRITMHLRLQDGRRHRQNHSLERAIAGLAIELGLVEV